MPKPGSLAAPNNTRVFFLYSEADKRQQVIRLDGRTEVSPGSVGAKGVGIDTMARLGLPLPPAFALSIELCDRYRDQGELAPAVWSEVARQVCLLREQAARVFDDPARPVLVSVRSSGQRSMPGMLDTALNVEVPYGGVTQIRAAVRQVVASWSSDRARAYRRWAGIADSPGMAAIVQAMVFGNRRRESGSGVAAVAGERLVGEWLEGAQGDKLMSGAASPIPIAVLAETMPEVASRLLAMSMQLQNELGSPVEVEFTVEEGRLFLLQVRPAVFPAGAEADGDSADRDEAVVAVGVPASPGTGSGTAAVSIPLAQESGGCPTVLIKRTTAPADVPEILAAEAVVTERGGFTSHAAVICREAGIPCVVGCGPDARGLLGRRVVVDGSSGIVTEGVS